MTEQNENRFQPIFYYYYLRERSAHTLTDSHDFVLALEINSSRTNKNGLQREES